MDFEKILKEYGIKCDLNTIFDMWSEEGRYYHNLEHLTDLIEQISNGFEKNRYDMNMCDKLTLVALFHDIIYDPTSNDNEEKSADFLLSISSDRKLIDDIYRSIIDTKNHNDNSELSKIFNEYDMNILNSDIDGLMDWEEKIFKEYTDHYSIEDYKKGRLSFLNNIIDSYPMNMSNIQKLIKYVEETY